MAMNGVINKVSILDTYKDNKGFGGSTIPGYTDAKEAGGDKPKTTDFVKGTWPEQSAIKGGVNAASGFTANIKKNGIKDTEFAMVDNKTIKTADAFKVLNTNTSYSPTKKYGTVTERK
jgi:hypothetical protein